MIKDCDNDRINDYLEDRFDRLENIFDNLNVQKLEALIESVDEKLKLLDMNTKKLDKMIKEFKGCVSMSRASLKKCTSYIVIEEKMK